MPTKSSFAFLHERTQSGRYTIEELLAFLESRFRQMPERDELKGWLRAIAQTTVLDDAERTRQKLGVVASFCAFRLMPFRLTAPLVDAVLRPLQIHALEEHGYRFVIDCYHEHPRFEEWVRKSITSTYRLRIAPVLPADGPLAAWLFDPWEEQVLQFLIRARWEGDPAQAYSAGARSVIVAYDGCEHPFSDSYLLKIRAQKRYECATTEDEKSRASQELAEAMGL